MDPLSVTASIIAVLQLTSKVIEYLNDVKDASKDRARCAIEASNIYNLLVTLRFRLDEGNSNEPWYTAVRALGVENGPLDQYRHALEQLQPKTTSGSGIKKVGNALMWRLSKEELISILARMERLKGLVQIALEMDHFKLSQEIKRSMDTIHRESEAIKDNTNSVRKSVDAIQQDQNRERHDMIMRWLSSTDFPAQQFDLIARRQEGTGVWFLNSPEFAGWIHGSKQTLFCPGIPGAGKTMVAAIAIDHLLRTMQSNTIGVAYIYCNYKAQADQTTTSLLAAILKQLAQARPCAAEPVARLHNQHADRRTRPSLEEIISALRSVLTIYSSVYVVVDALDECAYKDGTRSQLLANLRDLQSKTDMRLMVTSRFIPEIETEFRSMPTLEVRASGTDVKRFVLGQIYRLPKCVLRDDELQGFTQDKIVEAVDGMSVFRIPLRLMQAHDSARFLLARLHVDSLLDKRTKSKVKSTLESLSKGTKALDEAYDEAIKRIDSQLPEDSALAKSVLSWISYAQRPLTTGELCHALAVEPGEDELDQDNIPDVEDIISVCAGLVTVDQESNIIRLVHYTTQEYFERIREHWNPSAQQEVASTCLNYLSLRTFRSGSCQSNKDFEDRVEQYSFLDYAAQYWGRHALAVQKEVSELALSLLQHSKDTIISADSKDKHGQTPLFLAAEQGHEAVVELLVERDDVEADSKDEDGQTPLLLAARKGHEAVVKLLVERDDVETDSKDENGRTPLSWAAEWRAEAVVKLLVGRNDVETDSKDEDGRTPLSWAAERGHEAVVKLLVGRDDVETDSKDGHGWTPLSWAAERGHEAVVKLLVERDNVEADSKDKYGQTPLSWAVGAGREAVVKLLVERDDIETDVKDKYGRTPLSWAAGERHEAVVKLLVERDDVEADSKDIYDQTPLLWAAKYGHEAVVKLLVEQDDVKADSKDIYDQTPLSWAAKEGHEAVVKLLVERDDVEADSKHVYGQTPLSWAAKEGHEAVVKLLVERDDVEADSEDVRGQTPLSWAVRDEDEAVVKLLAERDDVKADSKDKNGWTPLSWAVERGDEAVVKLLVERDDVETDSKDETGRTPLSWAAERGHEAVIKLLIERDDVKPDSKDKYGRTPLSYAAEQGHEAVVKLLIERDDIETDSKDEYGRTPLLWATKRGHEAVVNLLKLRMTS
ncbi:hypothetical protein DL764_000645 [Monosporascus ibericus]|uniref:Uncharacterized protein n=1 Tax=Monosporascus ibericus TaxID=155417 RepID=A0A4Q4TUC5_9PEZI|nr:hypothetical protein DL764_000645 [Monosporascus ibericus]